MRRFVSKPEREKKPDISKIIGDSVRPAKPDISKIIGGSVWPVRPRWKRPHPGGPPPPGFG